VKATATAAEARPACPACIDIGADGLRLRIRVQPRASRTRIVGPQGDCLKVAVQAPPVDGAANAAVIALIAAWLGVAKSRVAILRGDTARAKTLRLSDGPAEQMLARVNAALASLR